jgi:two-component system sensor kinase FixL
MLEKLIDLFAKALRIPSPSELGKLNEELQRQIVERELAAEKLRHSEERFRLLVEGVQDYAIYMLDPDGFITTWNSGAERMKGYSPQEILGKHYSCFYFTQDAAAGKPKRNLKLAEERGEYEEENYRVRKDGSTFCAHVLITALRDSSGKLRGFAKVVRDITQRRLAEEKFKTLLESAPDAMVIIDERGAMSLVNTQAEKLFGFDRAELLGKPVEMLIPKRFEAKHQQHRAAFSNNPRLRPMGTGMELYALRKDGSEFPVEISLSPMQTANGIMVSSAIRDITERKESERILHEKERLATLGTTAAVFAHEIGNPLNGLSTSLQLTESLLKGGSVDPVILETLQIANQEVQRLTALLKDYRSFARPRRLDLQPVDIGGMVQEVLAACTYSYRAAGIRVDTEFDPDLPALLADKEKMKQAVLNLCKNAAEAMPCGGVLTCKAYQSNDQAILEINDTGDGIPEGVDAFQLFVTTKPEGTGLGLPIVQQIVSEHHGIIEYVSEPGKGTTFRMSLPLSNAVSSDSHSDNSGGG